MYKRTLILSVAILFSLPLIVTSQTFSGGVLGGVSASQVDGDSYAGFDKVGLHGGVFVRTSFTNKMGMQMEIKYTGRGARKKTSETDPVVYQLSLHYIDIPLMMNFTARQKFIFEAGLVPGYLFALSGEDSGGKIDSEQLGEFKKFDLGWLLGFRYQFTDKVSAGIRYSYSLFSILDSESSNAKYGMIANLFGYNTGDYSNYLSMGVYYHFR
ncbi:MAG: PorT family protein [Bacteroidales bacterium]|nr:PorT family protein [Bacteroidales bacterium]